MSTRRIPWPCGGIAPRIPGVSMHSLPLSNGSSALIVKIPKSWASPHMVTLGGTSRFFSRNSAGKYRLDVDEIRSAFLATDAISNRIREFRLANLYTADNSSPSSYRINIDGLVTYLVFQDKSFPSYTQLFRNGAIEAVSQFLLSVESLRHLKPSRHLPSLYQRSHWYSTMLKGAA